jgi:aspartate/methionine/tyrosine aminotransferase
MNFEAYPFEKLTLLLEGITPNEIFESSNLTIGEPQFKTPQFIQNELQESTKLLNKYPKSMGEIYLREAMLEFINRRFNIQISNSEIIPTFGTREVLFNFPQYYLFDISNPTIAFTNPFYQIYEGAAIASRAKVVHLNLTKENNFIPSVNDRILKKCNLVILNFPNNPTGATISSEELQKWIKKALQFNFVLINDECYSEIYFDETKKPASLLEACKKCGNNTFKNCLVVNSISKRSSAPGLRSGFIAGDKDILEGYLKYRTYVGCASPLPLQKTATIAWADEKHIESFRNIYKKNFELAKEILNINIPDATFYIWLEVENELIFTQELYKQKNIKVLPGSFLSRDEIGKGYVRIALVEDEIKTQELLRRLKDFIDGK